MAGWIVVNDLKGNTYFAKLVLSAENETQQMKIIEIDALPGDCIAMATQQLAPIFMSLDVWDEVEDMIEVFRKLQGEGPGYGTERRGGIVSMVTSESISGELLTLDSDAFESQSGLVDTTSSL